ncbi:MAG: hypothetical protein WKF35_01620 [Ferruginibacter sp.]
MIAIELKIKKVSSQIILSDDRRDLKENISYKVITVNRALIIAPIVKKISDSGR